MTAEATWRSLPEPLAARILLTAFYDTSWAPTQRLRISLVCRAWCTLMKREAVDVQLPNHKATFIQLAALLMTRVQIRSIAFAAPGATGCRDPCTLSELAAAEVATSPAALAASKRTLEEAHNLIVLKGPKHKTALARFTALRCLSLHNTEGLSPGQVDELLASLPASLESLRLWSSNPIKGHTFACLPRLRELYVQAVAAEFDDLGDLFAEADLAGLPAGLQTLEIVVDGDAELMVRSAPGPPAALLRLAAAHVKLDVTAVAEQDGVSGGGLSAHKLELNTGALGLRGSWRMVAAHDWAMRKERLAQFFVEWFQICGATALHLNVVPVFSHGFDIDIFVQLGIPDEEAPGVHYHSAKELLHAVQSACQQCGVRCTDLDGTGRKIVLELV